MCEVRFRRAYEFSDKRRSTPIGSRIADKMSVVCGERGNRYLKKTGETNLYDYIQSFKDEVDLNKIIDRCMMTGDVSLLQRVQGAYLDVTGLPSDNRTAQDILNHTRQVYESLDAKVKAHYKGFEEFLDAFANEENFKKFVGLVTPSETVSEVKEDEPQQ